MLGKLTLQLDDVSELHLWMMNNNGITNINHVYLAWISVGNLLS